MYKMKLKRHVDSLGRVVLHKMYKNNYFEFSYDKEEKAIILIPTEISEESQCIFCKEDTSNRFLNIYVCEDCQKEQEKLN